MTLAAGTLFGSYQISGPLGAGGMGEVYRATDTKLKRDVALKVLPPDFTNDAERLARFQREAELLAALNHNNIAHIHGIETFGGVTALIMELIDGPTLAERIEQGPIPPDEALNIALQICAALEAAHERGIVHRDLKPANIKLKSDGTVKVLDFGIAKAIETTQSSGRHSPTIMTPAVTESGVILGTAAYMSPEQARGKAVDARTDIWAFGCVLFEMLTGQPAFGGEDVSTTLARVLERNADLSALPTGVMPAVRHTIELCLRKDPKKRIRHISDVRLALEGEFGTGASATVASAVPLPAWRRILPHAATLLIGGLVIAFAVWNLKPQPLPAARPLNRFTYSIPADLQLQTFGNRTRVLAVSPDGRQFAYNTTDGLYLRSLGELEAHVIPGTEGKDCIMPMFSPDGQSIAYFAYDGSTFQLERIPVSGGAPIVIAAGLVSNALSASWAQDDSILFLQPGSGINRVSANGGTPELIIPRQADERLGYAELLPDGMTVLFSVAPGTVAYTWAQDGQIVAQSLTTGERRVLIEGGSGARYLPAGYLVYTRDDVMFAVAFDSASLTVSGNPVPVVQGVRRWNQSDSGNFGIAADGTLVYMSANASGGSGRRLALIGRDGSAQVLNAPLRNYSYAQLSPDGTRAALESRDVDTDVWIFDLARETLQRLTFNPGFDGMPLWSPDGTRVATSRQTEVYWQPADGSGVAEALTHQGGESKANFFPSSFAPDGSVLLSNVGDNAIWMTTLAGPDNSSAPLLDSAAIESNPALSPDGRWLAYQSNESGRFEIYVRPFPDVDSGRWQISTNGGTQPDWSADGSELFYLQLAGGAAIGTGAMMAVPIQAETSFMPGRPVQLFTDNFVVPFSARQAYDATSDGRFLMMQDTDDSKEIVIVENFVDELRRLVPVE